MIGYLCAYLRYYYPAEFITAYLNNANNEDDIKTAAHLLSYTGFKLSRLDTAFPKTDMCTIKTAM